MLFQQGQMLADIPRMTGNRCLGNHSKLSENLIHPFAREWISQGRPLFQPAMEAEEIVVLTAG